MSARLREAILDMLSQIEIVALDSTNADLLFRARELRQNLWGY